MYSGTRATRGTTPTVRDRSVTIPIADVPTAGRGHPAGSLLRRRELPAGVGRGPVARGARRVGGRGARHARPASRSARRATPRPIIDRASRGLSRDDVDKQIALAILRANAGGASLAVNHVDQGGRIATVRGRRDSRTSSANYRRSRAKTTSTHGAGTCSCGPRAADRAAYVAVVGGFRPFSRRLPSLVLEGPGKTACRPARPSADRMPCVATPVGGPSKTKGRPRPERGDQAWDLLDTARSVLVSEAGRLAIRTLDPSCAGTGGRPLGQLGRSGPTRPGRRR